MLNVLNKHPYDWILHAVLCFIALEFSFATLPAVIFVALLFEYEQRFSIWNNHLTWWEYFKFVAVYDLVADAVGILGGVLWT